MFRYKITTLSMSKYFKTRPSSCELQIIEMFMQPQRMRATWFRANDREDKGKSCGKANSGYIENNK